MNLRSIICAIAGLSVLGGMGAATPQVHVYGLRGNAYAEGVSHNGRYAVFSSVREDNTLFDCYGHLVDVEKGKVIDLAGTDAMVCGALDVSDDGTVVGCYGAGTLRSNPAFWRPDEGWTLLPYPAGDWEGGIVSSVTTDGRFAVGKVYRQAMMWEEPVLWELGESPRIVETPGVPYSNRYGVNEHQTRFNEISADGRLISGTVSFSYMGSWSFMYDRETGRVFTPMQDYVDGRFVDRVRGMNLHGARFSADGRYYFGSADWRDESGKQCHGVYRHEIATGVCTLEEAEMLDGAMFAAMDDGGAIYCSAPGDQPVRDWYVLSDGYWIGFDQILRQVYGKSLSQYTGYDNDRTGTIMGISGDGRVIGSLVYYPSGETYLVELPEPASALASGVRLLEDYTVTPAAGVHVSALRDFRLAFTRNIWICGGADSATLEDRDGTVIARSIKMETNPGNGKSVDISFRKTRLEAGKEYLLRIPAGSLSIAGNAGKVNSEITVAYHGRSAVPVAPESVTPASGMSIARFTASGNPVLVDFDTEIALGEATGTFSLVEVDGRETELCRLGFMVSGSTLIVWPAADQNLFVGNRYRLRIAAGSVTDMVGENGNREMVIEYEGVYEPDYNPDDTVLFSNNFDDGSWNGAFLFYEGDHNQPSARMQTWNFLDGDGYPWWWVRDDEQSADYALASHSMYSPAGKSDDRCVIPRLYIPDEECHLTFKSQSYLKGKCDRLKVYVWPTDMLLSSLNDEVAARMSSEWVKIYDEQQDPGKSEELLAGDWRENILSLADFAGKNIYIAFVNDNEDQSAVFIDDVAVTHNSDFTISVETERTVVCADEIPIKGKLRAENAEAAGVAVTLMLKDSEGDVIDTAVIEGKKVKYGEAVPFAFASPLPLIPGCENRFMVELQAAETSSIYRGSIANLAFDAEKRVVMEEGTGMTCSNCPMGIVMLEMLGNTYGERFIPLSLHTYTGDPLGAGLQEYASFLGITAYPSAVVNRSGAPVFAMKSGVDGAIFSDPADPLWWDVVADEMKGHAMVAVSHRSEDGAIDSPVEDEGEVRVPIDVCYPLDRSNVNDYLLSVLVEDDVPGYQVNGLCNSDWPVMGEWGKGGAYGYATVTDYPFCDVVRAYWGATFNGTSGAVPTEVKAGEHYYHMAKAKLPATVADRTRCSVVSMVIDGNSGRVCNAVKSPLRSKSGASAPCGEERGDVYSIDGRCVMRGAASDDLQRLPPGLYIYKGRKVRV